MNYHRNKGAGGGGRHQTAADLQSEPELLFPKVNIYSVLESVRLLVLQTLDLGLAHYEAEGSTRVYRILIGVCIVSSTHIRGVVAVQKSHIL